MCIKYNIYIHRERERQKDRQKDRDREVEKDIEEEMHTGMCIPGIHICILVC